MIPTVDLSRLDGTATERAALAEELRACCHEGAGVFYLVGHGIEAERFRDVFGLARAAFALPAAAKAAIDKRKSARFRGYEAAGSEKTQGRPDHREQIDTWSECAVVPGASGYDRLLGPNQFIADDVLPGYRSTTMEWHRRCSAVAKRLIEALSLALRLAPDAIDRRFGSNRQSLIKYIHYPPTPAGAQGVGLHQDSAYLTLLVPGEEAGLECQLPSGEMMPVGARLDARTGSPAFVVNLGEALQLMTGNYFVATPHRVSCARERLAVGFFYGPSLDCDLRPLALPADLAAAVEASERHRTAGIMPTREEIAMGIDGSLAGAARHKTYGDLLWGYFSRAYPELIAMHHPER